jgi:hypothetical protein
VADGDRICGIEQNPVYDFVARDFAVRQRNGGKGGAARVFRSANLGGKRNEWSLRSIPSF